jgi:hypothetical protein
MSPRSSVRNLNLLVTPTCKGWKESNITSKAILTISLSMKAEIAHLLIAIGGNAVKLTPHSSEGKSHNRKEKKNPWGSRGLQAWPETSQLPSDERW